MAATPGRYWMLQRFIPEIKAGETRTLICGDSVLGSYLRTPNPATEGEFRTNLALQGSPGPTQLSAKMENLVNEVHAELRAAGVGFAAIDTVGVYLMEVYLANPGGFGTLCDLYGRDFEQQAGQSIVNEVAQAIDRQNLSSTKRH
jgi:glutathione synthase